MPALRCAGPATEAKAPRGREPLTLLHIRCSMKTSKTRPLPPLPDGAPGRPAGDRYKNRYGVIVLCRDEGHQQAVYDALRADGHKLRVVTV